VFTSEQLHGWFEYLENGWLRRKTGPFKGKLAGTYNSSDKYIYVYVEDKKYAAHQLIWCMHTGRWPELDIDHKDRIRDNNRIENLRECSRSVNLHNREAKGIRQLPGGTWEARGCRHYIEVHLGCFTTAEEARVAYLKFKGEVK